MATPGSSTQGTLGVTISHRESSSLASQYIDEGMTIVNNPEGIPPSVDDYERRKAYNYVKKYPKYHTILQRVTRAQEKSYPSHSTLQVLKSVNEIVRDVRRVDRHFRISRPYTEDLYIITRLIAQRSKADGLSDLSEAYTAHSDQISEALSRLSESHPGFIVNPYEHQIDAALRRRKIDHNPLYRSWLNYEKSNDNEELGRKYIALVGTIAAVRTSLSEEEQKQIEDSMPRFVLERFEIGDGLGDSDSEPEDMVETHQES